MGPLKISKDAALTYIQENVSEFVATYASPAIELRVLNVEHDRKIFVAIAISPFERIPVVCKKNTPDGVSKNDNMKLGEFFVRTADPVNTMRVQNDAMMHDLLERATGRRAAELIRTLTEGGVRIDTLSLSNRYDKEVEDLGGFF